jgi:hypothetical protein
VNLALGIALGWLGGALLWVAFHGIGSQNASPAGVINTITSEIGSTANASS